MSYIFDLVGKFTIIIVAHRLSTVEKADYLYYLENGQIVYHGIPSDLILNNNYNSKIFNNNKWIKIEKKF